MKRFCALLLCLLLACPAALAARKPEPSPTPAPDHTVQLAAIDRLLADHPQSCDITAYSLTCQELTDLLAAHPDVSFTYNVTLYGLTFPGDATTIDFEGVTIQDVTELKEGLSLFPRLEYALMYDSPIAREDMDELAALYPDLRWGWTLRLGSHRVRTDTTAFSSLHSYNGTRYTSGYYSVLKYCWQLKALDLGHNKLTTIDFVGELTDLRVLILADNQISDITPLQNLKHLEYVELFMNKIKDISPLEGMEDMLDLNLCFNSRLTNIDAVTTMPRLERLWAAHCKLSKDYQDELAAKLPHTKVVYSARGSTAAGWREHPRYDIINEMFHSWIYIPFTEVDKP